MREGNEGRVQEAGSAQERRAPPHSYHRRWVIWYVCPFGPPKGKKWRIRDLSHFGLNMVNFAFLSAKSSKSEILLK